MKLRSTAFFFHGQKKKLCCFFVIVFLSIQSNHSVNVAQSDPESLQRPWLVRWWALVYSLSNCSAEKLQKQLQCTSNSVWRWLINNTTDIGAFTLLKKKCDRNMRGKNELLFFSDRNLHVQRFWGVLKGTQEFRCCAICRQVKNGAISKFCTQILMQVL